MKNLDYYLSTPDELFNTNVQFWYFEFSGSNKLNTEKPFEVFAEALHEVYFFIQDNLDKPFSCIEKINSVSETNGFNEVEKLILVDKILGVLFHHPEQEKQQKVFIQLVDFRNDLSPFTDDPDIQNPNWHFDIEAIKTELTTIEAPTEKHKFLMNLLFDYSAKAYEINELEHEYYESMGFIQWIETELQRCEYIQEYFKTLPPQPIVESPFSVLEWATIFYYADETKLLSESRLISERMREFMSKHKLDTTFDNFKTTYYEAKRRINEKNDYPINKLESIIPFLKENYKQTVTKVENDIIFLEGNKPEY